MEDKRPVTTWCRPPGNEASYCTRARLRHWLKRITSTKLGKIAGSMSLFEPDFPVFAAMLRGALGDRVSESATFPPMLAEHVEIEHPYLSVPNDRQFEVKS